MPLKPYILLILILLAANALALDCNGVVREWVLAPAVNDLGKGQIVNISLEVKPGDGTAYVATEPIVGGMTQTSGHEAMIMATGIAGYDAKTCDVLFKIGTKELDTIDGPSAGAAMTMLVLSALNGQPLPRNFSITGTIEPGGKIGLVGGLPEKAQAVANAKIPTFIVPILGFEDRIILSAVSRKTGIAILQASDINSAMDIAYGRLQNYSAPKLERQVPPVIPPANSLSDTRFSFFRTIAEGILSRARASASAIQEKGEYGEYFNGELDVAENAISSGYLYTGANTAFLASINSEFLLSSGSSYEQIEARAKAIDDCYNGAKSARMDEGNWEWVIGAQIRSAWAKKKVVGITNESFATEAKALSTLKDVAYAEGWCKASSQLLAAQGWGKEINQELFKPIAGKAIEEAEQYLAGRMIELSDQQWHLEAAKQEFDDGLYAAASYDASYALYMAKGYDDFPRSTNAKEVLESGRNASYRSVWASLYKSQMEYLMANGDEGRTSLQLLEFADGLENKTYEMAMAFGGDVGSGQEAANPPAANTSGGLFSPGSIILGLLILFTLLAILFVAKQAIEE